MLKGCEVKEFLSNIVIAGIKFENIEIFRELFENDICAGLNDLPDLLPSKLKIVEL